MNVRPQVEIPARLVRNKRDRRGYPIPYIVYRDAKMRPHFQINDNKMVKRALLHERCGLCGDKLEEVIYFVGGPASALHENGAFIDPPMHKECAEYALKVCPFLAMPNYAKRLSDASIEKIEKDEGETIATDEGVMPGRPSVFVLLGTHGFVNFGDYLAPRLVKTDVVSLDFWKDGVLLDPEKPEDDAVIEAAIQGAFGQHEQQKEEKAQPVSYGQPMTTSAIALGRGLGARPFYFG